MLQPFSATFLTPEDLADVCRPVRIEAALSNAVLPVSVEFLINGHSLATVNEAPYRADLSGQYPSGEYFLGLIAIDARNRRADSTIRIFLQGPERCEHWDAGCADRCDCPVAGEICVAGRCEQAPSDGSCVRDDQCPLGSICDFDRTCVPGCAAACDCSGGKICNLTTLLCGECSSSSQCPEGLVCNAKSECVAPSTCTDAGCQAKLGDVRAFCNTATMACELFECLTDADCFESSVCDVALHQCSSVEQSCTADCNGQDCPSMELVCDPSICACIAYPVDGSSCPDAAGLAVMPDGTACDATSYASGICVDACDPTHICTPPDAADLLFCTSLGVCFCR